MSTSRPGTIKPAAILAWLLSLAIWMLARSLNLPEPWLHSAGLLVFAQVQAVETRATKSLRPFRLLRQLRAWLSLQPTP